MAVTVTYLNVGTGGAVPTFAQALNVNTVVATVAFGTDADAAAVISHNFSLPAADISAGWPTVMLIPLAAGFGAQLVFVASLDPNYVGLTRGNTSNGGTHSIRVVVARPNTYVR